MSRDPSKAIVYSRDFIPVSVNEKNVVCCDNVVQSDIFMCTMFVIIAAINY